MITLILPGQSVQNKDWALDSSKYLDLNHEIRPVLWEHWDHPDMPFDAKDKAHELVEVAMTDSINIIAKSIGSLVACYILQEIPNRVEKLILCGIPINDLTEAELEVERTALGSFPAKSVICFQNENDPHGNFDQVKDFLAKVNSKIKIVSKPRDDHEYPYFQEFQEFLLSS
jgi:pimeloyl-ACP methyl ester carboxylesterase